jgi:hypothetical protein
VLDDPFVDGFARGACSAEAVGVRDAALRELIGEKKLDAASPVEQAVREAKALGLALAQPRFYVAMHAAHAEGAQVTVGAQIFESPLLAQAMRPAEQAAALLVTVGRPLAERVTALADEKNVLAAYLLDAVGSVLVEELADLVQGDVAAYAARHGLFVGYRYSPGYCDWDIREQAKLFALLDAGSLEVRLPPSMLMDPRKSISAVFPLGRDARAIAAPSCFGCAVRDCKNRRTEPYSPPLR